jgi:hypothetical protein
MHNQHAGLSQSLAEQLITDDTSRPTGPGSPTTLSRATPGAGWLDGGSWPASHASLPSAPNRGAPSLKRETRRVS